MLPERLKEIEDHYLESKKCYSGNNEIGISVNESVIPLSHRHCGELIQEVKALESVLSLRNDEINGLQGMLDKAKKSVQYWKHETALAEESLRLTRLECDEEDLKVQELKDELESLRNSLRGPIPFSLLADEIMQHLWARRSNAPMFPGETFRDFGIRVEAECYEIRNNIIDSLKRKFPI